MHEAIGDRYAVALHVGEIAYLEEGGFGRTYDFGSPRIGRQDLSVEIMHPTVHQFISLIGDEIELY